MTSDCKADYAGTVRRIRPSEIAVVVRRCLATHAAEPGVSEDLGAPRPLPSVSVGIIILTLPEERSMARGGEDAKVRAQRSLNPRPGAVSDERFASAEFLDARDLVQVKYEMVRRARVEREPVSRAA